MPSNPPKEGLNIRGKGKQSGRTPSDPVIQRNRKSRSRKRRREGEPSGAGQEEFEAIPKNLAEAHDGQPGMHGRDGIDDEELGNDLRFEGAEDLASPEAGPSRLPMTPSRTSFTPLPRSVLSGLGKRPSSSPDRSPSPANLPQDAALDTDRPEAAPPPSDPPVISEHFEPPGLFSAPMDKVLQSQTAAAPLLEPADLGHSDADAPNRELLLPVNVIVDGLDPEVPEQDDSTVPDLSMEGLFFVDDNNQKGVQRYFVPEPTEEDTFLALADQSKICQNCKKPGHRQKDCPHIICTVCGAMDEHERRDCPHGITCFGCGQRGHRQSECPDPASRKSRKRGCDRCGSRDHPESACPTVWRIYKYYSSDERMEMQDKKRKATNWAREALGDIVVEMFCYNCAQSGHLGDDCPRPRASAAKLFNPTAFSHAMARRGPYFSTKGSVQQQQATPSTHLRFDEEENLPDTAPGFKGGNAGKKTRDKVRKAMIDREAGAGGDDEDDWFANQTKPVSTPNGNGRGLSIRGRGAKMNGTQRRPWDSDSRPTQGRNDPPRGMPFGHSHLMASAPASVRGKGILFNSFGNGQEDSPSVMKGKGKKSNNPAKSMLARAIKGSQREQASPRNTPDRSSAESRGTTASPVPGDVSVDSARKRRKKKNKEEDEDLESTWWTSGKGGGNVAQWDKDMPKGSVGRKQGVKGNKGQQYTGGY